MGPGKSSKLSVTGSEKELPALPEEQKAAGQGFRHAIRRINISVWLWELLSLMTSLSCVTAIVVILAHYDGKPLPNWGYGLTLNGVVSLLAVTAKSSLILPIAEAISQLKWSWFWNRQHPILDFEKFDSASRGPWGSLMLLCHPRVWNLACLGAALTVAAMAIEPSLQQIPTYISLPTDSGQASLPRSLHYEDIEYDVYNNAYVSSPLKGAIYGAIFDSQNATNAGMTPECTTGNCTWPVHSSLGVCSACENLTSLLTFQNTDAPTNVPQYKLPNGARLMEDRFDIQWSYYSDAATYPSIAYKSSANTSILDLSYLYIPPHPDYNISSTHSRAFECMLFFCVKTYNTKMVNGVLNETVESTWPSPTEKIPQSMPIMPMLDCIGRYVNIYKSSPDECPFYKGPEKYILRPPGQNSTFTVNLLLYNMLRIWIGVMAEVTYRPDFKQSGYAVSQYQIANDLPAAFYDSQRKSVGSITEKNGTTSLSIPGPDVTFERIATAMTNHMRSVATPSEAVIGTAHSVQTTVRARWAWAIFPIALLVTTLVYVLVTLFISVQKRIPMWKSSSLASLLHGLDAEPGEKISAERLVDMENNAKLFAIGMSANAGGRVLQTTRLSP